MKRLGLAAAAAAIALAAFGRGAAGQDAKAAYDPAASLYVAGELALGGYPLWAKLFANGWPTTRDQRRLTIEKGAGAFRDAVAAHMASGCGVPLSLSSSVRARAGQRKIGAEAVVKDKLALFSKLTGYTPPSPWEPIAIPYRKGEAALRSAFSESDPATWAFAGSHDDKSVSLRAVGLAIHAEALLAEQELVADRQEDVPGGRVTLVGRRGIDAFLALAGLESALAAAHELRSSMIVDKEKLVGMPGFSGFNPRVQQNYFPTLVVAQTKGGSVSFALPADANAAKDAIKSRLADESALLLGLSQLATACDPARPGLGRFFSEVTLDGKKTPGPFEKESQLVVADLAYFVLESSRTIHLDISRQRYTSVATPDDAGGGSLRTEDIGLYLVACEAFVNAVDRMKSPPAHLADGRKRAAVLVETLAKALQRFQTDSTDDGFYEAYGFDGESVARTTQRRPLGAQGAAARGLLAAHRITGKAELVEVAARTLRYLEKTRWDPARRAYLDAPGQRGQKVQTDDAAAVLGALRDAALATSDVRYLVRYRELLGSLRARGFQRSAMRPIEGEDGPKAPAASGGANGMAPVFAPEVVFP